MKKTVLKLFDSRLFWILVSLVAAFVLWLFVVNSVNPVRERTLTFNVQFEGEGVLAYHNLRLASDTPRTVDLRVEASFADVGRLEQNPDIIVDVSGIQDEGEHDVTFILAAFPTLTGGVTYRPMNPMLSNTDNTIVVRTNRVSGQLMALSSGGISYELAEAEEENYFFVARSESIEPESIQIDGSVEMLERIAAIEVVSDFGTDLAETTTQAGTLRVYDHEGELIPLEEVLQEVTFSQETVNVTVSVGLAKRVPLVPRFEYGAGANVNNVFYELSRDYVWLRGDVDVLQAVDYVELTPSIRLDRVVAPLHVTERDIPPPALTEIYEGPSYVEVSIQIRNVVQREFVISRDQVMLRGHQVEEVSAEVVMETLTVVIRGPEADIEELDENQIRIIVDLSDYGGRLGRLNVEDILVLVGDWDPEIVGAMDMSGITVNLQRLS